LEEPSKFLFAVEAFRALYEYALSWALDTPLQYICPRGDGHPVLLIPGLGGADSSTAYLQRFLKELGYDARPWGLGRNYGPRGGINEMSKRLAERVQNLSQECEGQQVSLIGWSLGGIYSREIAKTCPEIIRQVITLGTPFKLATAGINVGKLYEFLSKDTSYKSPEVTAQLSVAPPVPFTSMYSKSDGVVHWKCSIEDTGHQVENIEVPGASHLGIGHNPISLFIMANRLSQTRESWKPYRK
jgi:pimeloyl-ACP methyl ester carboxylesterase